MNFHILILTYFKLVVFRIENKSYCSISNKFFEWKRFSGYLNYIHLAKYCKLQRFAEHTYDKIRHISAGQRNAVGKLMP